MRLCVWASCVACRSRITQRQHDRADADRSSYAQQAVDCRRLAPVHRQCQHGLPLSLRHGSYPGGVLSSTCLSVCLFAIIASQLHARSLHRFSACYLCPWLGQPLAALRYAVYFRFRNDVIYLNIVGHMQGCRCNSGTASQPARWCSQLWLGCGPSLKQQAVISRQSHHAGCWGRSMRLPCLVSRPHGVA